MTRKPIEKPKNLNDWRDYPEGPKRWTLLSGRDLSGIMAVWGLKNHTMFVSSGYSQYMAEGPDGLWRHVGSDTASVSCDETHLFEAEGPGEAWAKWNAFVAIGHINHQWQGLIHQLERVVTGLSIHHEAMVTEQGVAPELVSAIARAESLAKVRGAYTAWERERPKLYVQYDYVRAQEGEEQ